MCMHILRLFLVVIANGKHDTHATLGALDGLMRVCCELVGGGRAGVSVLYASMRASNRRVAFTSFPVRETQCEYIYMYIYI